jgi:hypothetical protein
LVVGALTTVQPVAPTAMAASDSAPRAAAVTAPQRGDLIDISLQPGWASPRPFFFFFFFSTWPKSGRIGL